MSLRGGYWGYLKNGAFSFFKTRLAYGHSGSFWHFA